MLEIGTGSGLGDRKALQRPVIQIVFWPKNGIPYTHVVAQVVASPLWKLIHACLWGKTPDTVVGTAMIRFAVCR